VLLIDLATDDAPADPVTDVLPRVRDRALIVRLDGLTERIQSMHPDDQGYSELMTELVRLRQARKVRVHE
jgi:hypothetical protein